MSIRHIRTAIVMTACAIATALLVTITSRQGAPRPAEGASPLPMIDVAAGAGRQWYVGDGLFVSSIDPAAQPPDGVPADWASSLHVVNPGAEPAHVVMTIFHVGRTPSRSAFEVPPGRLYSIDLARRRDVPRDAAFWIAVEADQPVFPQLVHQTFRPWDLVPEGVTMVTPQPAPLDDSHTEWIYPDAFQGGTRSWLEQETITLLNPWPAPAQARLNFEYRDGRPARTVEVTLAAERVTAIELQLLFPAEGSALAPALSGDFSISISATRPVVSQQTRRVYWRGRKEITSLSARVPMRRSDALEAREWYYAGGWTRDLRILPRDGQTDRTWHLLFTYPLEARSRALQLRPAAGDAGAALTSLPLLPGRSDLQWLHQPPWRELFGGDERPWGFSLQADGPVAPAVTTAEFEPWSQAMPGGMGAGNLVSDVAARRQESWLGVAYHGGADHQPTDWSAAWQVFNPGTTPLQAELSFHVADGPPLVHHFVVGSGRVTRVTGDAVPGLPLDRPFAVRARGDRPFAAHAWVRAQARGQGTVRALSSAAGVAIQLDPPAADTDAASPVVQ
jgi:hypothetical protein